MSRHEQAAMSAAEAIRRRSVRGFLSDKVPEPVIPEAFELAQCAPSNCNVQPAASRGARPRRRDGDDVRFRAGAVERDVVVLDRGEIGQVASELSLSSPSTIIPSRFSFIRRKDRRSPASRFGRSFRGFPSR